MTHLFRDVCLRNLEISLAEDDRIIKIHFSVQKKKTVPKFTDKTLETVFDNFNFKGQKKIAQLQKNCFNTE